MSSLTQQELDDLQSVVQDVKETVDVEKAPTIPPSDTSVVLPIGLWDPLSGLRDHAEVRELNGFDEEVVAKSKNVGAALGTILERAVVAIGDTEPQKGDMDLLTIGDRLELLVAIRRVTWGDEIEVTWDCPECQERIDVVADLADVPRRLLDNKETDRVFDLDLPSGGTARMSYPTGKVHREVLSGEIETGAEMTTALIVDCVKELPDVPVVNRQSAKALPVRDRRAISDRLADKIPGPVLDETPVSCPSCDADITVPVSVGALFPV